MPKNTILFVVDDDLAVRESLKFALQLEGFTVHACASGAELLAHPALDSAHCVVLDQQMPEMGGFEVLDHLARHHAKPPVIMMTGRVTPGLRHRAEAAGVRHVLEKPLLDGVLLSSIREVGPVRH